MIFATIALAMAVVTMTIAWRIERTTRIRYIAESTNLRKSYGRCMYSSGYLDSLSGAVFDPNISDEELKKKAYSPINEGSISKSGVAKLFYTVGYVDCTMGNDFKPEKTKDEIDYLIAIPKAASELVAASQEEAAKPTADAIIKWMESGCKEEDN